MLQVASTTYADYKAAEFEEKSLILGRRFRLLPPQLYLEELFFGSQDYRLANFPASPSGQRIRIYESSEEMLADAEGRYDAFYYPSDFLSERPYPRKKLLKKLYALIVDLDRVSPKAAKYIADAGFFGIVPTYVVNSGGGLHLVFAFDEPVECYDWTKALLDKLYTRLKKFFKRSSRQYVVDESIGLLHAFRLPGTMTKYGNVCEAYRTGESWPAENLADRMNVSWKTSIVPQYKKNSTEPRKQTAPKSASRKKALWKTMQQENVRPNAQKGFYGKAKQRMLAETPIGNRYTSMLALSAIAYKCNVPEKILEKDLEAIRTAYNDRHDKTHAVRACEIKKAMKGYNPKATLVTRATLNEWLGFEFRRCKRNGLSRKEHLAKINAVRSSKSRNAVEEYFRNHPDESTAKAARDLGMSRNTVKKYRPAVSETAAQVATEPVVVQDTVSDSTSIPCSVDVGQPQMVSGEQTPAIQPLEASQKKFLSQVLQKPAYRAVLDLPIRFDRQNICKKPPRPPKFLMQQLPPGLEDPANFAVSPVNFFRTLQYFAAVCLKEAKDLEEKFVDIIAGLDHDPDAEEMAKLELLDEYSVLLWQDARRSLAYLRAFSG